MESSRLKNIIILILVLTNLCLLGLLAVRLTTGYSARETAAEQMASLFAAEGVRLDTDRIPGATPPAGLTLARDQEEERRLAEFLLGDVAGASDGGGVRTFQSGAGTALFRADGSFDAALRRSGEAAEDLCRAFCRAFHYTDLTFSLENGSGTASAVQTYDGAPVVNCTVTFTVENGAVSGVSGTHLSGGGEAAAGDGALSALGALNALLDTVRSGAVVTAVTDIYLCYELQSTAASPMSLVPAWCVVTDTENYYVNSSTGAVSAA